MRWMRHGLICSLAFFCGAGCEPTPTSEATSPLQASRAIEDDAQNITKTKEQATRPVSAQPTVDTTAWRSAVAEEWNKLAKRFADGKALHGKSEDDIVAMLGPPDFRAERLVYSFQTQGNPSARTPALLVNLDRSGKAVKTGYTDFPENYKGKPFHPKTWKSGSQGARMSMAIDIWQRKLLIGKSRADVQKLLGKPSRSTPPMLIYYVRILTDDGRRTPSPTGGKLFVTFEKEKVSKVRYSDT